MKNEKLKYIKLAELLRPLIPLIYEKIDKEKFFVINADELLNIDNNKFNESTLRIVMFAYDIIVSRSEGIFTLRKRNIGKDKIPFYWKRVVRKLRRLLKFQKKEKKVNQMKRGSQIYIDNLLPKIRNRLTGEDIVEIDADELVHNKTTAQCRRISIELRDTLAGEGIFVEFKSKKTNENWERTFIFYRYELRIKKLELKACRHFICPNMDELEIRCQDEGISDENITKIKNLALSFLKKTYHKPAYPLIRNLFPSFVYIIMNSDGNNNVYIDPERGGGRRSDFSSIRCGLMFGKSNPTVLKWVRHICNEMNLKIQIRE